MIDRAQGRGPIVWALTGPIGGGKTLAAAAFADLGAVVIDADVEGHAVLAEPETVAAIAAAFGDGVIRDGAVDRVALGRLVFADAEALTRLNALVHPRLSARLAARLADLAAEPTPPALAVVEAAVYFQLPGFAEVALVVCITASETVRIRRLVDSGRCDEAEAARRVAAQRPLLRDWEGSDIVLANDGDADDLVTAVRRIHDQHAPRRGPAP